MRGAGDAFSGLSFDCPFVLCLSVNIDFAFRDFSVLSGEIWMKLAINVQHVSGHRRGFQGHGVKALASLAWVTPGAACNWGCHPSIFSWKTWRPFFSPQFCGVTPDFFISSSKNWRFFCSSLFIAFTRVSPPRGCHPTPFLPVRPRFSTILCKFAHNFFLPVSPPGECYPGRSPPPSPSDATGSKIKITQRRPWKTCELDSSWTAERI